MGSEIAGDVLLFDRQEVDKGVFDEEAGVWRALAGLCVPSDGAGLICHSSADGSYSLYGTVPGLSTLSDSLASRGISVISARENTVGECVVVGKDRAETTTELRVRPVGQALLESLLRVPSDSLALGPGQHELRRAFMLAGEACVSSPGKSPNAACRRASIETPHDEQSLVDWFWQRDACLMLLARDWPACWGGNYRIGEGKYVSQEAFERVLPSIKAQSLWIALANLEPFQDAPLLDDFLSHLDDTFWIHDLAAFSVGLDDAPVYYTEERPEWIDEIELSRLLSERPDLIAGALHNNTNVHGENRPLRHMNELTSHPEAHEEPEASREDR